MTKLARPIGSAVYGLRILNHHISRQLTDALEPHNLSLPQMGILADLRRVPGVSGASLARVRALTPQTMSEILTDLEKESLIERRAEGGRTLRLFLTPAGATRLSGAFAAAASIERRMLAGLSPKEQERFRDLIFRCVEQLTAKAEQEAS